MLNVLVKHLARRKPAFRFDDRLREGAGIDALAGFFTGTFRTTFSDFLFPWKDVHRSNARRTHP
jgi:hypothetical protein